jgi:hypothetical protein
VIFPKNKAEEKRLEAIIEQNKKAEDWVSDDPSFEPLSAETTPVDEILKRVGDRKLPTK